MSYALGAIAFVIALLASVMLHEAGHFITAKKFGMKATQFFVGFGPTVWSWHRGETEYGVKAVLLGGFVKIVGYTPLERIEAEDRPRAFYRQPAGRRAIVIGSGVLMNFALAFVLLLVLAMGIGLRTVGPASTVVASVSCVPVNASTPCRQGDARSPAQEAGLRSGDKIVAFDGKPVKTWDQLRQAIRDHPEDSLARIVVERGGSRVELPPVMLATFQGRPFLGMTPQVTQQGHRRLGPIEATTFAGQKIGETLQGIGKIMVQLPLAIPKLFSADRASTPAGQVGSVVGAGQVSGQIFSSNDSWQDKAAKFSALVISVNIFVGALNVLPLLPLDGGHLAVLWYERVRARIARMRGMPDPGTVDLAKLMPVTYVAVVLLIGLGVLLILADVVNPLKLPQ